MRKLSSFILLLVFIAACSDKRPSGVLPKDKMREVMWDMLKAGEFLDGYVLNHDSSINKAAETVAWYEEVYKLHNITKARFDESYAYYKEHPQLMKEILDSLGKQSLQQPKPDTADSATAVPSPSPDSVKTIVKKDSVSKKANLPEINIPLQKRRSLLIDSIKRSRLLQRKQPIPQ